MKEADSINLVEEDILISIDILRDVLNEMCCTIDEHVHDRERLMVSQQMDRLIVDYMGLRNKNNKKS